MDKHANIRVEQTQYDNIIISQLQQQRQVMQPHRDSCPCLQTCLPLALPLAVLPGRQHNSGSAAAALG